MMVDNGEMVSPSGAPISSELFFFHPDASAGGAVSCWPFLVQQAWPKGGSWAFAVFALVFRTGGMPHLPISSELEAGG